MKKIAQGPEELQTSVSPTRSNRRSTTSLGLTPTKESAKDSRSPSRFSRLSPSKPKIPINALLRPKFTRSRTSVNSIEREDSKPTTLEDFADTDSSNDDIGDFSSVIIGYTNNDDKLEADFIFKESFDDLNNSPDSDKKNSEKFTTDRIDSYPVPKLKAIESENQLSDSPEPFYDASEIKHSTSSDDDNSRNIQTRQSTLVGNENSNFAKSEQESQNTNSEESQNSHSDETPNIHSVLAESQLESELQALNHPTNRSQLNPEIRKSTLSDSDESQKQRQSALFEAEQLRKNRISRISDSDSKRNSENSANFVLRHDSLDPLKKKDRKNVLSTSSNIDPNRSSLYNLTTSSAIDTDHKYPDPNITPMATPKIGNNRDPGNTTNTLRGIEHRQSKADAYLSGLSGIEPVTNNRDTFNTIRSSMSSGELLNKLDNSYDFSEVPLHPQSKGRVKAPTGGTEDFTAGIDSTSELPIMLYKVQDKDYDESNNRWSVYENKRVSEISRKTKLPNNLPEEELLDKPELVKLSPRLISIPPRPEPQPSSNSIPEPVQMKTSNRYNDEKKPQENYFDEKYPEKQVYYEERVEYYSWGKWCVMMVLGLLISPVYFLVASGVFDHSTSKKYYSGLYYTTERDFKFTKKQKIISFVLGILWFMIVLAMIGLGIGLGLRNK